MRRVLNQVGGVLKRVATVGVTAALALGMAVSAPVSALAADADWDISKSKTATGLDENYQSQVTLSLPSSQENLATDVVFVLDKSKSYDAKTEALKMLESLTERVEETSATVNIGIVKFNREAQVSNNGQFYNLVDDYDEIVNQINGSYSGGTNTHAGLLAGKAMLDNDTSVDASRKYLIFVSDGITYLYGSEPTSIITVGYYGESGKNVSRAVNTADAWNNKYGYGVSLRQITGETDTTAAVQKYLDGVGQLIAQDGDKYDTPFVYEQNPPIYDESTNVLKNNTPSAPYSDEDYAAAQGDDVSGHANNIDKALYLTAQVYQQAEAAGYHCYAIPSSNAVNMTYPWGAEFMEYLSDGEAVSFSQIENDIYYLLDAGSTVTDVIGYGTDSAGNDYDFDFIDNLSSLQLTVGGVELDAEKIEATQDNQTSAYGFGKQGDGSYRYVVHYFANGQDGKSDECFVWDINESVSNFDPVQLTYTVRLTNPQVIPGTYENLMTNKSATLYPVDTNGQSGAAEAFEVPVVTYSVSEPSDITIGGDSFRVSKVLENGTLEAGQFEFQLVDEDGNVVSTATNAADGSVKFDDMTYGYDEVGTHHYTISEVLPTDDDAKTDGIQKDGVTYDEHAYKADVVIEAVADESGALKLKATVMLPEGGKITFTNTAEKPAAPEPTTSPDTTDKPAAPEPATSTDTTDKPDTKLPGTGDPTSVVAMAATLVAGAGAGAVGIVLRRRSR